MSLLISSEKSKYWEIVNLIVVDTSFLEFYSLLESSDFLFGNKYCQLFSWRSDRFTSSFSRKYLSYTQFGIISLSVILSSESYVPWKRQLVQLTTQTKTFPWTNHRILVCSRSALCVLPLHCCHVAVKNKMPTRLAQFGPLSQIVLRHQQFQSSLHYFCIICTNVNTVKKTHNILVLFWNLFWPGKSPERVSAASRGPRTTLGEPLD